MKKTVAKEPAAYSALSFKLLLLFQFLAVLRAGRWTIKQLMERFDCGKTKSYRFIKLIEEAGFYLLLREKFPMALPYLKHENEKYAFSGPVASYAGIGRFVMGLQYDIEILEPEDFKAYVRKKV